MSSLRRNSLCDVTQRRAAAMYSTTHDACCRLVAGLPASVSNWSHQIACRRCYCVRRAAANNPQYYDSVDSRPPPSPHHNSRPPFELCVASRSSLSIAWCSALGLCLRALLPACLPATDRPDNKPVFTANFIVCRQAHGRWARALLA